MKAQAVVISEIITFTIGVTLVIGLAVFLSSLFLPNVEDYVYEEGMDNFLNYVDSSFLKIYSLTKDTNSVNLTYKIDFPDKLIESIYYLSIIGRKFCVNLESVGIRKCLDASLPLSVELSGYYISGTKINIELYKSDKITIQFSNSY